MLPPLAGRPIRVEMRDSLGPHHASTSIARRVILLDKSVFEHGEFERILLHEIAHFSWVRLSNSVRRSWEQVLVNELTKRVPGELGWSAERRKERLKPGDGKLRSRAWRLYACESFCDTAAWLWSEIKRHEEFTLSKSWRNRRRRWFEDCFGDQSVYI
jgi:hypothetical protein